MANTTIKLGQEGTITLPADFRQRYQLSEGDLLTVIDMGDGALLLTPRISRINQLADGIAQKMQAEGMTLEALLQALDEERERLCFYLKQG